MYRNISYLRPRVNINLSVIGFECVVLVVGVRKNWSYRRFLHVGFGFGGILWMHDGQFTHPQQFFMRLRLRFVSSEDIMSRIGKFLRLFQSHPNTLAGATSSMIKVNWNTAIDVKHGRIGFGIITRDCEWQVLAVRSTTQNFVVKLPSWLHAVIFCKEICFIQIIV